MPQQVGVAQIWSERCVAHTSWSRLCPYQYPPGTSALLPTNRNVLQEQIVKACMCGRCVGQSEGNRCISGIGEDARTLRLPGHLHQSSTHCQHKEPIENQNHLGQQTRQGLHLQAGIGLARPPGEKQCLRCTRESQCEQTSPTPVSLTQSRGVPLYLKHRPWNSV